MHDGLKVLLFRITLIAGAALFYYSGFDWRFGALLVGWIIITWLILRTYDDWGTFLKRCLLSLPFIALCELVLYMLIRPERYTYWCSTALLFDALLLNVPKVWPHYVTMLSGTTILISISLIRKQFDASIGFYTHSRIFLAFFCLSYLVILNCNKDKYFLVLTKSFISGVIGVLFIWVFTLAHKIIDQHNISSGYAYIFSCFLGLIIFLVFYNLGKKYFEANNLFKRGKIALPFTGFLNKIL